MYMKIYEICTKKRWEYLSKKAELFVSGGVTLSIHGIYPEYLRHTQLLNCFKVWNEILGESFWGSYSIGLCTASRENERPFAGMLCQLAYVVYCNDSCIYWCASKTTQCIYNICGIYYGLLCKVSIPSTSRYGGWRFGKWMLGLPMKRHYGDGSKSLTQTVSVREFGCFWKWSQFSVPTM